MKKEIHPKDYRLVVFKDISNDEMILTKSCTKSRETIMFSDGKKISVQREVPTNAWQAA